MLYIQETTCISSLQSLSEVGLPEKAIVPGNKISVIEPDYSGIPEKVLRRMGKAVRLGVGSALSLIGKAGKPDAIIIGTANGGMEDCIKFLNQIIEYDEGMLTPTNFVQSTANAIAGQVGMMLKNTGYNITHVHRGHSFENSLLDAVMHLRDNPGLHVLVGAVDEISAYNFNIDSLDGWYKTGNVSSGDMYSYDSEGSFAGEGAAMFSVTSDKKETGICLEALETITSKDPLTVTAAFNQFTQKYIGNRTDLLYMSGENGDIRMTPFYRSCEAVMESQAPVARFKHITGEYATASAIAVWLACEILRTGSLPHHMLKSGSLGEPKKILIYNNHKGLQHSFILLGL
ncbi:MAG: hypothetical protein EOO04_22390 [Chitinophagaceae bacterium]|nr:MAG: hypothetical protein EOO04_22390 [Chitinophagaceae bacterium]